MVVVVGFLRMDFRRCAAMVGVDVEARGAGMVAATLVRIRGWVVIEPGDCLHGVDCWLLGVVEYRRIYGAWVGKEKVAEGDICMR